ncbi:MAG: rhomboid family intramembrane serine protease [Bacterioplanes sp.]|nr:rhomboid family intramembrane serine protease [Bacterioplanes sp.]
MNVEAPILALVADASVDLSPVTRRLWAEKIPHRVLVEQGQQYLYLASDEHLPLVQTWLQQWQDHQTLPEPEVSPSSSALWFWSALATPLTSALLLVWLGSFLWMSISNDWQQWLTQHESAWPHLRHDIAWYWHMGVWSLWRPTLLHFGALHLLMNAFWWWILARPIEQMDGAKTLLVLVFACGLFGNLVQWWYAGPLFGGASGVTLGLLGWIAVRQYRRIQSYQLPSLLLPLMVGWLLLTLLIDHALPGWSGSAHGAHIGGLLCGIGLAWLWPRKQPSNTFPNS